MGRLSKGSPNQKRRLPLTLASLQAFNAHIDIIAFVYELVTEQKEDYSDFLDGFEELDFIDTIDTIKKQFGTEKEIEIYLFANHIKNLYVTDYRNSKNKIANKQSLVYFDDEETLIRPGFNAELLHAELQLFYEEKEKLEQLKERMNNE
ncbi:MAG: hypothetical protein ACRCW9_09950 [Cetobacterium sp.]